MHHFSILILGYHCDDGGPVTLEVFLAEDDARLLDVDIRFGLQPPSQTTSTRVWYAVDKVPKEQPFVGMAAERDDTIQSL